MPSAKMDRIAAKNNLSGRKRQSFNAVLFALEQLI
jgi:hypothetical protein